METLNTTQTSAGNIYNLTNKLTLLQTHQFIEIGLLLCLVGFLLAEHSLLFGFSNAILKFFTIEPATSVPSGKRA